MDIAFDPHARGSMHEAIERLQSERNALLRGAVGGFTAGEPSETPKRESMELPNDLRRLSPSPWSGAAKSFADRESPPQAATETLPAHPEEDGASGQDAESDVPEEARPDGKNPEQAEKEQEQQEQQDEGKGRQEEEETAEVGETLDIAAALQGGEDASQAVGVAAAAEESAAGEASGAGDAGMAARSSVLVESDSDLEAFSDDEPSPEPDEFQRFHDEQDSFSSSSDEEDGLGPRPPSLWPSEDKAQPAEPRAAKSGGDGGGELLAAENELLRKQLAEVQAALAAKERGPPANPLQFRPRPELDLPPVTAPELIDDGTLNLVAAAGVEAHALDAAAKQRKAAGGDEGLPVWVAAPDGVSANTASAVDSVLSAHLHAEEGAAAFMYDDVAAAVDRFGAAAEAAFDDEDGAEAREALSLAKAEQEERRKALLWEGAAHLDAKHWKEAVLCYEMAEQVAPKDDGVRAAADEARKARDFVLEYRSQQAIDCFHRAEFASAEGWFERALSIAPPERCKQLRTGLRHVVKARKKAAGVARQAGAEAYVKEQHDVAVEKFYEAMELDPESPENELLAEALQFATAEGHEAAVELRTVAEAHFAGKRWGEAVATFERVCRMGRGSAQEKEYQADLAYARRIRDGLVSEAHNLATKCLAKGELEEALELTTRAVDMAPGHAESQESLAYLQRLKRQADGATAAKEELLETGKAHLTDQRYADAARSFGAALKLDPSDEVRRTDLAANRFCARR